MHPDDQKLEWLDYARRADRLGIPYAPSIPLAELRALVETRESEMGKSTYALVNGRWEINGELPLGLTFVDGKFVASNGASQPECFGEMWDGTPAGSAECRGCVFSPVCLEVMAQITFTAAQAALGTNATLAELAAHCDVSEQAVLAFLARKKGEAGEAPAKKKKKPPVDEAPTHVVGVDPAGGPDKTTTTVLPMPPAPAKAEPAPVKEEAAPVKEEPPAVKEVPKAPETTVAPVLAVGTPEAPTPKAKGKRKTKAKAPKADKSAAQHPRKARPVKRAKAGARARKAKNARPAKARVGAPLGEKWGEHTWLKRWERERERCPQIRRAVPGAVLTVERGGQTYRAKVAKGYYELSNGQKCPTLCEAAKLLTGNANWSAVRFWGLDKAASKPPKALQSVAT